MAKLTSRIKQAAKPVQVPGTEDATYLRRKDLLPPTYEETGETVPTELLHRKAQEYSTFEVTSSKGKKYRVTVPISYALGVPKVWEWNETRLKVAELIALGIPMTRIVEDPDVGVKSRHTIYAWLEHPEFREHVDALISETGFASQRERIAGLTRLTQKIFNRIIDNAENIPITDKSIGSLITGVLAGMKQIAQEKGEFVEMQQVEQSTNISGTLATATIDVNAVLKSKSEEDRKALQKEFDNMGDDIIRQITGGK